MHDHDDYVLCECDLDALKRLVMGLEHTHQVQMLKEPSVCLTMIRAEGAVGQERAFLGEALTTECEVLVDGHVGIGVCLGEEPVRGYCMAVVDALLHGGTTPPEVSTFLDTQRRVLAAREAEAFDHTLATRVDIKLVEQE